KNEAPRTRSPPAAVEPRRRGSYRSHVRRWACRIAAPSEHDDSVHGISPTRGGSGRVRAAGAFPSAGSPARVSKRAGVPRAESAPRAGRPTDQSVSLGPPKGERYDEGPAEAGHYEGVL